ncbi:MAG TPA: DUF1499 domain-containing protein [Caulifigura sp.]|nr:DUF1499 domain-containing protein [Caulifigura sp.]
MTETPQFARRIAMSPGRKWSLRALLVAAVILFPYAVTYNQPAPKLGATLMGLKDCPQTPNCVCSDLTFVLVENMAGRKRARQPVLPRDYIAPLQLKDGEDASWKALEEVVRRQPGIRVVESSNQYLHVERRTTIYGLIDDVEFCRLYTGTVLVRSAARIGYADFGRNRRFVERIRSECEKT